MKSLIADGWHHRSDSISSVIILVGIFAGKYFWWADAALGIIVSLFLLHAAYKIIKDSGSFLIGEHHSDNVTDSLMAIAEKVHNDSMNIHHIHVHDYGKHSEITFHIRLPDEMTLLNTHSIASDLEKAIRKNMHMEATIHVEPIGLAPDN